ncbi:N5-glutamine methyltransferase family protein [Aquihabitans daechungensis]|uniref:N5-glutamine methyltransferase family protein n=1 Tax=Aquihabitans daechungensis TaxID=1052257 RepID=UPI003B9FA7CE
MIRPANIDAAIEDLARAGFLAPTAEAAELAAAADGDDGRLAEFVDRRVTGEPLAWITGTTTFCGEIIHVHPGVYVPRPQTEPMAIEAVDLLPEDGIAVDLCTGSGAIAAVLGRRKPRARILATDLDPVAVRCAIANGVEAIEADVGDVPSPEIAGRVDVVTAVVPYVPTDALHLLPSDVLAYEPRHALDGGDQGTAILIRTVEAAARILRPGGWLLVELGGHQDRLVMPILTRLGYTDIRAGHDDDGDLRSLRARASARP